ncbi:hypothetical protein BO94DRAFT_561263 [Aspergillus sclerotioniger CBS 115572]|uniref:Uncharacterized protein n=1 Tax=Aspergillus sclerotioniger CBS 115572 TaxID=1450535 RepID=A0A317UZJ8_9EURO|nr:hypothetical protein BO94DRAFT_561263 [Aspergillus sclerotioniger CBS 115572]PWY66789.1 hypothetical protein BO94DRAFT_561263 [Aspergillus sclerotioniger CBS 115572]
MSTTTTTTSLPPSLTTTSSPTTTTNCTTANIYILPIQDAACALPNTGNASSIMSKCCSPASPTTYDNDCGIYCLAQDQSVRDLLNCIQSNGAVTEPFCSGNMSATATASISSSTSTGSKTGTSTGSAASGTHTGGAVREVRVSKWGVGVLGLVVSGLVFGGVV